MAHVTADRILETTTTAGTGSVSLGGAVLGYYTLSSAMASGDTCYYVIFDTLTGDNEEGIGTYVSSGNQLARTTVMKSSNSNALVSFSSNSKQVFITAPAAKFLQINNAGLIQNYSTTGSGSLVLSSGPVLVTPTLGAATATSVNGLTISSTTGVLTLANGSTLATSGAFSTTFTATGATSLTLPTTGTLATTANTVASLGGTTGTIALGTGLSISTGTLNVANGATGTVTSVAVSGGTTGLTTKIGRAHV